MKRMKKCTKKSFIATTLGIILIATGNFYKIKKQDKMPDIVLANIEALATGESNYGCAGNPTFIPDEALRTVNCWNGGTHKKCKKEANVCCDPSQ